MDTMTSPQKTPSLVIRILRAIWSFLPAILIFFVIMGLAEWMGAKKERIAEERAQALKAEDPGVNVVTLALTPRPISDRINLPGIIAPWVKLDVLSEVQGKIVSKHKQEGEKVHVGDTIAVIDKQKYENGYQSARAAYEAATASKHRLEQLYKKQLTNKSDLDNITAQVENLKAAMDNAALDLQYCTITSPLDGMINRIYIEVGQYVNVTSPIAEVIDIDKVKVRVGIPESDVNAIRHLNEFTVTIDALGGRKLEATKHFLSKIAGSNAILYDLELTLPNPDLDILPGMFTRVDIVKQKVDQGISVPLYAVISNNDTHLVYVENGGIAHVREVEIGIQDGWMIQIKNGLKAGEKVVVTGQRDVNEGQALNVIKEITNMEALDQ